MTTEQATRAAIVAAVRAFVQRVCQRALDVHGCEVVWEVHHRAIRAELAALERAAAEEGAPEGGSQEEEQGREDV